MAKRSTATEKSRGTRLDIRTVAEQAGVSISTVSRVVNGRTTVDADLSRRVWEVVNRLGYTPSAQARALVSGRSRLFGVLISDLTNPFFPELIQSFEEQAFAIGYETVIGSTRWDLRHMELSVQRMIERKVEGVAVMTFGIEAPMLERLAQQGIPFVFMDVSPLAEARVTTIEVDYAKGIGEGVRHLVELGHHRIAFISGPHTLHSAMAREEAFREASQACSLALPDEYIQEGAHTVETGTDAAVTLLGLATPPTAILCSNDLTAIGVMHAAFRAGVEIPRELSVIGFDDIHFARYTVPPMTSIRMSPRELASAAVRSLQAEVNAGVENPRQSPRIDTSLVIRQTTAPPRTGS